MNEKDWQEIKNIPMDYGKIEKIEIKPKDDGWEWFIAIPGRLAASGFCLTLDSAIDRVKQMTEEHWKEAKVETLGRWRSQASGRNRTRQACRGWR